MLLSVCAGWRRFVAFRWWRCELTAAATRQPDTINDPSLPWYDWYIFPYVFPPLWLCSLRPVTPPQYNMAVGLFVSFAAITCCILNYFLIPFLFPSGKRSHQYNLNMYRIIFPCPVMIPKIFFPLIVKKKKKFFYNYCYGAEARRLLCVRLLCSTQGPIIIIL